MKKIIEIILGYLLLISIIFIVNHIFKFENDWFSVIWILLLYSFIVYLRINKKAGKVFLDAMNKSRKRQKPKK